MPSNARGGEPDGEVGDYRWRFRADNNEIVASGEGYNSKDDCEHAVQLIKEEAPGRR